MLIDGRAVERGSQLRFDVCIIGAGAAGITLARQLSAGGRLTIGLIESGGLEDSPEQTDLQRGESVGRPYFDLARCRLRFLGGATNHWSGYCRPLDRLDFEPRAWIPDSGWPITRGDLDPYYQRAHEPLELGPYRYDARFWQRTIDDAPFPLDPRVFDSTVFQMSPPTRFGVRYRDAMTQPDNITLLTHSNVVAIEPAENGKAIEGVAVRTLAGESFRVSARTYVLAAGGLENPRLLLLSRSPSHPHGLGNSRDVVGRYFMEHPHLTRAILMPSSAAASAGFYHSFVTAQGNFLGALRLRRGVMQRERLNNGILTLRDAHRIDEELADALQSPGAVAYENLARHLERSEWPDHLKDEVWSVVRNLGDVALAHTPLRDSHRTEGTMFRVLFRSEQTPDRNSRVTLAEEKDALGLPRVRLDWRLSEQDFRSLERAHEIFAREVGRAEIGRVFHPGPEAGTEWLEDVIGACHHMGTTRMHENPARGVVDADCRVHGISNLWIAGSSVFPTSGCANPTLTLVALALRLGDRLRADLT